MFVSVKTNYGVCTYIFFSKSLMRFYIIDLTCKNTLSIEQNNVYLSLLGTGTNACYMEETTRIAKWQGDKDSMRQVIINMSHYYGFFCNLQSFHPRKNNIKGNCSPVEFGLWTFHGYGGWLQYRNFLCPSSYSLSTAIHANIEIFNLKSIFF